MALPAAYCRIFVFLSGPSLGREVVGVEETRGRMGIQVVDDQSFCLFYNPRFPHRRLTPLSWEAACMLAAMLMLIGRTPTEQLIISLTYTNALSRMPKNSRRRYVAKRLEFLLFHVCKS